MERPMGPSSQTMTSTPAGGRGEEGMASCAQNARGVTQETKLTGTAGNHDPKAEWKERQWRAMLQIQPEVTARKRQANLMRC